MDRAERRHRNKINSLKKLKLYWSKYGVTRIYDRKNKKYINIANLNDALNIKKETNGRLFSWFNTIKNGNKQHHSDPWIYYENKRIDNKEKRQAMKQMNIDVENALDPYEWENYCGACDNFPGDGLNEPSKFIFNECPRKGQITANTCWKNFNCPNFWD